jgi:hypothetical protein
MYATAHIQEKSEKASKMMSLYCTAPDLPLAGKKLVLWID